jgi:HEAT repeat protein
MDPGKKCKTKAHIQDSGLKIQDSRLITRHSSLATISCLVSCVLCLASCILWIGCGERENRHLVDARMLIQQGKYKTPQEIEALRDELNLVLEEDSEDPEALCPLKAFEIIGPNASITAQQEAVAGIMSLVGAIEDETEKLEAIDKDLLTDEDKENLETLNRKWNLSLEPAVLILKSQTDWISDVGRPAIDLLIESLKVSNPVIQRDVVNLLVSLKEQSFEALIEALEDDSSVVRRQVVIALGKIGDEGAVEPMARLLDDEDPGVRFYIPVTLDMIAEASGPGAAGMEKIVDSLHKAVKNEMAQVRVAATNILGKMEDETSIDLLIELLADDNSYVKTSTTNALIKIGEPVVPKLIDVLDNEAENIPLPPTDLVGDKIGDRYKKELAKRAALQVSAASILGSIEDPRAIKPLLEAMKREVDADATEEEKSNAASIRSGASAALTAIGPAAVELLLDVLENSENENARGNAASILGDIGDKRAVLPLIDTLKDEKKSVRANAAASLGTLKDRRAVPSLMEALKDDDVVTRTNAAASLGTIADKTATQALMDVVVDPEKKEREQVRDAAIGALGTLKDTTAIETLVNVAIDEYEKDGIRKSAMSALRTIENSWPSEALMGLLKGEMVYGISMPTEGVVSKWLKKEGDKDLFKDFTVLAEISNGEGKTEIKAPNQGTLVKIYVQEGEEAKSGALIGLISFEDKEIDQEERSSIRSAAASALGKVKGDGALSVLMRSARKDKSAAVRKNAANSIWEIDKAEGRETLIKVLKGDDSGIVRSVAALGLGKGNLKGGNGVPPLIRALRKDKYESARVQAGWSLGEIANKRSIKPLLDVIVEGRKGEAEASAVVSQAVTALDKIAAPAIEFLVSVLEDKDMDEIPRSKAAQILGLIENVEATEPLIEALKDESVVVRSEASKALGVIIDRRAVEPLIEVIADEDEWVTVRANAVTSLGNIKDERAAVPLIDALESGITAIRGNAVVALGKIKDKRATMPIIQILEDEKEDDTIRANAISSLGSIGDIRAVNALIAALNNGALSIRQNAAVALGDLAANAAVEPLMAIVVNVNEPVDLRANAAEALGKIGDMQAASLLRDRLGDYNESDAVWKKVAHAAEELRVTGVPVWVSERARDTWEAAGLRFAAFMALTGSLEHLSVMLEMLDNSTKEIRSGAAIALGKTGSKEAVQPLIDKLQNDGEEIVRRDSAKALADLADPASEQALIKAHQEDAKESVRIESAIALGNIAGQDGVAALIKTIQDTSIAKNIRCNAAKALGTAGKDEAIPALKECLKDNIGDIHFEAAEALRKITGQSFGYER